MRPLDGITVADFSRVLAGPMATQILSDLGAKVIKIESPDIGDESRTFEPFFEGGQSAYFSAFNRGKSSIALDLRQKEGQKIALEIASKVDVVVENFLPGGMARRGLGYADVCAINPRVVYVSNTGFGQSGPYKDRKGYDTVFQALSGLVDLTGHPDGPPAKVGVPFSDMTSGLWIVISALSGLMGRATTGKGCHVDLAMMDVQVSLLSLPAAWWFAQGITAERVGTEHMGRVPSAAFQCADGDWVFISGSDQHWPALCKVLNVEPPPWSAKNADRVERREEIMAMLRYAVRLQDRTPLADALRAAGVPVGEVNTVPDILADAHTQARNMVRSYEDKARGPTPALATPGKFSGYDDFAVVAPPRLGEQTDEVLSEMLGLSDDVIKNLRTTGVIK